MTNFTYLFQDALSLLHNLCTADGILASTIEADNYKRIWARDSMVCGLAGLLIDDEVVIEGLKNSLLTLASHQNGLGMIPSNVSPIGNDVSFGSLVGRIDANTWFILGSCLYYNHTNDHSTWNVLLPAVDKCREFLKAAETNDKGWIYTPLSGNWADEYPIHGYTLYDNMLRKWGEKVYHEIAGNRDVKATNSFGNFWPSTSLTEKEIYHKSSYDTLNLASINHFIAFILPGKYDTRFDAAGNALAMMQGDLNALQKERMSIFIKMLNSEIGEPLIPAFWPIITEESEDYHLLKGNYSYSFKNLPGEFHNGGIWPVWMGLFCLGLANNEMNKEVRLIIDAFVHRISQLDDWNFQEYFHANTHKAGGKSRMGYSASGIVFMKKALDTLID